MKYLYYQCTNSLCTNKYVEFKVPLDKFLVKSGNRYEIPEFYCRYCISTMEKYTFSDNELELK